MAWQWADYKKVSKTKTEKEKAKEDAHLSRVQICTFNLKDRCRAKTGASCNFAHDLKELQLPEESNGNWSEASREIENGPRLASFGKKGSRSHLSTFPHMLFMYAWHSDIRVVV